MTSRVSEVDNKIARSCNGANTLEFRLHLVRNPFISADRQTHTVAGNPTPRLLPLSSKIRWSRFFLDVFCCSEKSSATLNSIPLKRCARLGRPTPCTSPSLAHVHKIRALIGQRPPCVAFPTRQKSRQTAQSAPSPSKQNLGGRRQANAAGAEEGLKLPTYPPLLLGSAWCGPTNVDVVPCRGVVVDAVWGRLGMHIKTPRSISALMDKVTAGGICTAIRACNHGSNGQAFAAGQRIGAMIS